MGKNSIAAREAGGDLPEGFADAPVSGGAEDGPGRPDDAEADRRPVRRHSADDDPDHFVDELKPGTQLLQGQYKIQEYLNSGGFGITYLATDSLERTVVIKECFPGAFCRRSNTIVRARSRAHQGDFRSVVRLFVQEARSLAKLIHPNIVGVHQVFEDNDTAYMAIDFIDGRDLLDLIESRKVRFTPAETERHVRKLLEAISFIHARGVLHRDISPDNILIDKSGEPILIDFGAAREQASKTSRALSSLRVVKDGYSPQEFYIAGSLQGPSSDLYALAASFHHVIAGEAPPDSQRRLAAIAEGSGDPYVPLAGRFEGYAPGFLEALDKAINVLPKDRIATAGAWLAMLDEARAAIAAPQVEDQDPDEIDAAVIRLVSGAENEVATEGEAGAHGESDMPVLVLPDPVFAPKPKPRGAGPLLGLAGAAVVAAGFALGLINRGEAPGAEAVPAAAPAASGTTLAPVVDTTAPELAAATGGEPEVASPAPDVPAAEAGLAPTGATVAPVAEPPFETVAQTAPDVIDGPPPATAQIALSAERLGSAAPAVGALAPAVFAPDPGIAVAGLARLAAVAPFDEPGVAAEDAEARTAAGAAALIDTAPADATGPVAAEQVAIVARRVVVPFTAEIRTIDGSEVPVISSVDPLAAGASSNGWLVEGTVVMAVNSAWLPNQEAIAQTLEQASADVEAGIATASVAALVPGADAYEVLTLDVPVLREVTLKNGVAFRVEPVGDEWRTVVAAVPAGAGQGLMPGDVLVAERGTGLSVVGLDSVERVVADLAAQDAPEAVFAVSRAGSVALARMTLARE